MSPFYLGTKRMRYAAQQLAKLILLCASGFCLAQTPLTGVAGVALGTYDSCVLTTGGGVKCWGPAGLSGDGTTRARPTAVDVSGLSSGVSSIAMGAFHACALTDSGSVKCWGSNADGAVGDGTTTIRLRPVNVSGLASGVVAIAAGEFHTCALTSAGGVKCWGRNESGALGDNTTTSRRSPVDVAGLASGVRAVAAGDRGTCALMNGGGVKCWGRPFVESTNGTSFTYPRTPTDVAGLASGVIAIEAGGDSVCALTAVGGVKCTMFGTSGPVMVDEPALSMGVSAIATSSEHTCAIGASGGVKCWGQNSYGNLGDNTYTDRFTPADVVNLTSGAGRIATRGDRSCAVTNTGAVKCWGNNREGQLGDNSTSRRHKPVPVQRLTSGARAIGTGFEHTCALDSNNGVKCWGENSAGELGDGTNTPRFTPTDVAGLTAGVTAVAVGSGHSCALKNGGVKCWGANSAGSLGDNSNIARSTPVDVFGLTSGVIAVSAGGTHSCAITDAGGVKCWGLNFWGALGNGSYVDSAVPVDVSGLTAGVSAIAAGQNHTCALKNGGVKCWGFHAYGALGDNTNFSSNTPVDVFGLTSGVIAIAGSRFHTCAITTSGGLKCWGLNNTGQLGDNTTNERLAPVDVIGLMSGVTAVAVGAEHTCAVVHGAAMCWGANVLGQLGDNSEAQHLLPANVAGLASGQLAVAAGNRHSCALSDIGEVKCWGYNEYGQVGDGKAGRRPFPADVLAFPPTFSSIISRKAHGAAGTFDLALDTEQTISGPVTVESRAIGNGHVIVFQFSNPVTMPGAATAVDTNGLALNIASAVQADNEVLVTLIGVADNTRATISISGVNGSMNGAVTLGFLVGDTNNSGSVNSSDISGVKARSGQSTGATNFKFDVNITGAIDSSDISAVKARSGSVLTP